MYSPQACCRCDKMNINSRKIKKDFPIFEERPQLCYLDNAATTQKPDKVIDAVKDFYSKNNSNIGRGLYDLASDATKRYKESRENIAKFINAESSEVIFVRNTTEAENLLASSLEFEGDILISEMAHHSEQLPWREKASREEKKVKYLDTEEGKISVESAKEKIDKDTGLVAISHISNVFGAENPVNKIIDIAHERNALVVLDVAQSIPHRSIDVKDLNVDFMAFSGHKMLGPTGIGVLYGKEKLLDDMKPYQVGGGMIESVEKDSIDYTSGPEKFEAGTPNIAGVVGLSTAVDYLEEIGMDNISRHSKDLAEKMRSGLEDIEGIKVLSPDNGNLVSFTSDLVHPHDIAEALKQDHVAVRAGHHCAQIQMRSLDVNGSVRASPYIYNTEEDVERLIESVKKTQKMFK